MRMRYWLRQSGYELFTGAGMAAVFQLLTMMQAESFSWESLQYFPVTLLMGTALMTAIVLVTSFKITVPLVLSFGATRRESFWGLQMMKLLPGLSSFLLAFVACTFLIPGGRDLQMLLYLLLCLNIGVAALSDLSALASYRFGRLGTILMVAALALFGGGVGGISAAALNDGAELFAKLSRNVPPYLLASVVIAAVLLVADLALEWRVIRKCEVKL